MTSERLNLKSVDGTVLNSILRLLILEYGGLSCAPNLANSFESISNDEMYRILECLVADGVLRRINDDDEELKELTRFPEQAIYEVV